MNLETISITGLVTVVVVCTAVIIAIVVLGKTFKKFSFKVGNHSMDIGGNAPQVVGNSDLAHRKCKLAKTHIKGIAVGLTRIIEIKIGRRLDEPINEVLFELLVSRMERRIIDNILENHIGNSQEEITAYTKVRARELATAIIAFYDEFYDILPKDLKEVDLSGSKDRLTEFLTGQMLIMFNDVKAIEKWSKK